MNAPEREQSSYRKWGLALAVIVLVWLAGWGLRRVDSRVPIAHRPLASAILGNDIINLISRWSESGRAARPAQGNAPKPALVYFVIDTQANAIWLERDGKVAEVEKVRLPEKMEWSVSRITAKGGTPLKSPVYLKARWDVDDGEWMIIQGSALSTFGSSASWKNLTIHLNGSGHGLSNSKSSVESMITALRNRPVKPQKTASILVTPDELQSDRTARTQTGQLALDVNEDVAFGGAALRWARMRDRILDEMIMRLPCSEEEISSLEYVPVPSFEAARATFKIFPRSSLLERLGVMRRERSDREAPFVIKYFKDGVWGVCMLNQLPKNKFLVSENPRVELEPYKSLLDRMVSELNPVHNPDPKFTAHYSCGATVELVGLCACPAGAQSQWWKPDGTPLAEKPYYDYLFGPRRPAGKSKRWVSFAIRVDRPSSGGPSYSTSSFSSVHGSSSFQVYDEYGRVNRDPTRSNGTACGFDSSLKTTDFSYGMGNSRDDLEKVTFKNIALYPGEKTDFKIIAQPADTGQGNAQ